MCSRFCVSDHTAREIEKIVRKLDQNMAVWHSGDIFPSRPATVLAQAGGVSAAMDMWWGFPGYGGKGLLINARAESALEKKTFRDSVLYRRCVIPADGFYEWNPRKEKFTFRRMEPGALLFMAGCFNAYEGSSRFVILTTGANASVSPVHGRMPLILERAEAERWLLDQASVEPLLRRVPPPLARSTEYEQLSLF